MHTLVVGAGSSGCVIAARLSADPAHRVTLLEAGPDYPSPASLPADLADGRRNSMRRHDWGLRHRPAPDQVLFPLPRGRVVGGSSAVNTCICVRGTPRDFDEWGELGLPDWSWDQCLPAFRRLERDLDFPDSPLHGADGPLPIRRCAPGELVPWQAAFLEAAAHLGHPVATDHNDPAQIGAGPHAMNRLDGRRISVAEAWLTPSVRARTNLAILAGRHVHRVLFDGDRAIGVEVARGDHVSRLEADRVVLCAGAIHTPGLLLRSGIGPERSLRAIGVPVRARVDAVGARLLDHPGFAIFLRPRRGVARRADPIIQVALRYSSGPGAPPHDMQVQPGSNVAFPWLSVPFVSLMGHVGKPRGHGTITWTSADPRARPRIDSRLLQDPEDRRLAREGMELLVALAETPALRALASPLWPRPRTLHDRDALDRLLRRYTDSGYHPCGTVPMGRPGEGACDGRGRVHGVRGLFVADASLMPTVPTGNIHLPTIMIAERMAAWLAEPG